MTETTYIAFDVWPEDAEHPFWERDSAPGGATVQLANGDMHHYVNAFHQTDGGDSSAQHEYSVGPAGELHVVLTQSERYAAGTLDSATTPKGSVTERVLHTYAAAAWIQAEGVFRPRVGSVDPTRNRLETPN